MLIREIPKSSSTARRTPVLPEPVSPHQQYQTVIQAFGCLQGAFYLIVNLGHGRSLSLSVRLVKFVGHIAEYGAICPHFFNTRQTKSHALYRC